MKTSIETLAERLKGKLWIKGDLKRIYLDRGHNTKKMSTKTYVFETDGRFIVSCKVECPAQAYQWCDSQEEEVKTSVLAEIEEALANEYYLLLDNETNLFIDEYGDKVTLDRIYRSDYFLSLKDAENFTADKKLANYTIREISREDFEKEKQSAWAMAEANRPAPVIVEPTPVPTPVLKSIAKTDTPTYGEGAKIKHSKFGIGDVMAESAEVIEIKFESVGVKQLMKKFVTLEIVE